MNDDERAAATIDILVRAAAAARRMWRANVWGWNDGTDVGEITADDLDEAARLLKERTQSRGTNA